MKNSFNIYNASAGSGKTFTLVKEYLSLLFNSSKKDLYKNILAITFTNKAVGEMKKRIIHSLAEFSQADPENSSNALMSAIAEETGLSKADLKVKSAQILKSIIHNYAAFEISTIDGFTHRVLRTFARDLGIPMNFEVELSAEDILMEAVESLINRAGTDEKLTRILIDFTLTKTDDDKSWDISRDLFNISRLLINENHQRPLELLKGKKLEDFQNFEKKLKNDLKLAEEGLKAAAKSFFDLIAGNGIQESDFSGHYIPKHFKKLQDGAGSINFNTKWAEKIEEEPLYPKKAPDDAKRAIDGIQGEIAEIFHASKKAYFQIEFLTEIKKNLVQLSLLNEINREVQAIKKDKNLVLISEFNPKISDQVKDQPVPFIYERLGERYQYYFIDEFQDTSTMQWENLIPLVANKLDSADPAGLTIVGDAKQSIYRWRGGRAEQLIELSNKKSGPFQTEQLVVNLPDNYRSGSEVVNFNNSFFEYASSMLTYPEYSELFKASSQNPKKGDYGFVNISFLEASNREEEFELYPEKILEIIQDLDEKGFNRNDICILTRKRTEGVAIAEYLSEHDVSVISSETLLLNQSAEVRFIIDLLYFSLNPEDNKIKLNLFNFLSSRYLNESEKHRVIFENLPKNGADFFKWLSAYDLKFDMDQISRLSLYESVEYVIRSFHLINGSDAYLQYFLDFVFETTQKTSNGIADFLDKWEQKKEKLSIVVPDADNAVQIMTIHKSKGLEFPVVIYPFANSDLQDTRNDSLWLDLNDVDIPVAYVNASQKMLNWSDDAALKFKDLLQKNELDTLNVLYVACTRAAQHLYILSNYNSKPKSSPNVSDMLVDYLRSIGKWDDGFDYTFGDASNFLGSKQSESSTLSPSTFYSSPTQNQAVHIVTRSGALWDSKQQEAIEKGEITHEILARINEAEDLDKAMAWAVTNGIISSHSREEISENILKIINHPDLCPYFKKDAKNLNEKELLTISGKRLRPDRLNFVNNMVTIIDYKTGGFVDNHESQVLEYASALSDMGYVIEKSLLVYTNNPILIRKV